MRPPRDLPVASIALIRCPGVLTLDRGLDRVGRNSNAFIPLALSRKPERGENDPIGELVQVAAVAICQA